jgi:hypothetical protein
MYYTLWRCTSRSCDWMSPNDTHPGRCPRCRGPVSRWTYDQEREQRSLLAERAAARAAVRRQWDLRYEAREAELDVHRRAVAAQVQRDQARDALRRAGQGLKACGEGETTAPRDRRARGRYTTLNVDGQRERAGVWHTAIPGWHGSPSIKSAGPCLY